MPNNNNGSPKNIKYFPNKNYFYCFEIKNINIIIECVVFQIEFFDNIVC